MRIEVNFSYGEGHYLFVHQFSSATTKINRFPCFHMRFNGDVNNHLLGVRFNIVDLKETRK